MDSIEVIFNDPSGADFKAAAPQFNGKWLVITTRQDVNWEGWAEATANGITLTDDNGRETKVSWALIQTVNV